MFLREYTVSEVLGGSEWGDVVTIKMMLQMKPTLKDLFQIFMIVLSDVQATTFVRALR